MSFVDQDDVIAMQEGLLVRIFRELMGIEIQAPFPRMTYDEAHGEIRQRQAGYPFWL